MSIRKLIGDFNVKKANNVRETATARRMNTLLSDSKDFMVNEAYKSARTNIIFSLNSEKGCKKIIITSASPGEGKTTTCLNLAIAFAQTEAKVLVIDADLRKPRIYRHLGLERENGLSDVLCGMCEIDAAIKHCEKQNLDCITSGQIPPNPAELLSSADMGNLLDKLGERYDYIFIDTPPVTVVTEAAAMAKLASGVIIVVRQNNTIQESIKRARNSLLLTEAKILGFILNDIDYSVYSYGRYGKYNYRNARKYGYGYSKNYGYGKGYGYGYGYGEGGYGYGYGYGYGRSYGYSSYGYGYGYKERARQEKKEKAAEAKAAAENTPVETKPVDAKPTRQELKAEKLRVKQEMKEQKAKQKQEKANQKANQKAQQAQKNQKQQKNKKK